MTQKETYNHNLGSIYKKIKVNKSTKNKDLIFDLIDFRENIAKKLNLNVADKPDSQDICFVPDGNYVSVIEKFRPEAFKKGNIKNSIVTI